MASEQFSLCWDNFHKNMSSEMNQLLEDQDLVDVTLAVEGQYLRAHKMVLSVCSPYFKELFKVNPCKHPIVFMKDVSYVAMSDLLQFMYQGEVQVSQENLTTFIKTAESLQVKGLTGDNNGAMESESDPLLDEEPTEIDAPKPMMKVKLPKEISSPPLKRKRMSAPNIFTSKLPPAPSTAAIAHDNNLLDLKIEMRQSPVQEVEEDFPDGSLDSTNIDDNIDDYSIEGANEPKAGTSTEMEGTSTQGQDGTVMCKSQRNKNMPRYIVDGFVFHVNITKGKPPMVYLRCMEYKRLGCYARAVIPHEGSIKDIKLHKLHNHPPDFAAEEKIIFMRELRQVMLEKPKVSTRAIYSSLGELYPNAAREIPFDSIRSKLNRWKRE